MRAAAACTIRFRRRARVKPARIPIRDRLKRDWKRRPPEPMVQDRLQPLMSTPAERCTGYIESLCAIMPRAFTSAFSFARGPRPIPDLVCVWQIFERNQLFQIRGRFGRTTAKHAGSPKSVKYPDSRRSRRSRFHSAARLMLGCRRAISSKAPIAAAHLATQTGNSLVSDDGIIVMQRLD